MKYFSTYKKLIQNTYNNIKNNIRHTPLEYNERLSNLYKCNIFLKREDLQVTRSFKIRGSLNKIKNIQKQNSNANIVCASAGNHAQGVAYSCNLLNLKANIFVPNTTPLQKINRIKFFGKENIDITIKGNNFSECLNNSKEYCENIDGEFIHPYDDIDVIHGQATIGKEINEEIYPNKILCCVGGGGLISGISQYFSFKDKNVEIYGVEPEGAASMKEALINNKIVKLSNIDTFVDGASVSEIGKLNFEISNKFVNDVYSVCNEKLCYELIKLYEEDGIICDPAGALAVCGLDKIKNKIKTDDNIVCIVSGGNNDVTRYQEIIEYNLNYLNLKHYFIIKFVQKPKQLKNFILNVLGPSDDIIRFEYIKKSNKNFGNVLIGIELTDSKNINNILHNLDKYNFNYQKINKDDLIYNYIV